MNEKKKIHFKYAQRSKIFRSSNFSHIYNMEERTEKSLPIFLEKTTVIYNFTYHTR